jgi:hypothetical protein
MRCMDGAGESLIVVRRGETALFQSLLERCSRELSGARVIWDRRMRDRRVIIRDDVSRDRRHADRRAAPTPCWTTDGFILTRTSSATPGLALRSLRLSEPDPRPVATTFESGAAGLSGACPHVPGRGLRTDDTHCHLYARQLREAGRQAPSDWPSARLRSLLRGSAV